MTKIFLTNGTTEGQTAKIADEKPGNLGTDLSRDYVYTEWDGVKRLAEHFATDLASNSPAGDLETS